MALDFAAQIHALTGFDADSTSDTDTGDDFDEFTAQWMNESVKEVINILPPKMLERCSKVTSASANYTNGTGVSSENKILNVIRTRNAGASFATQDSVFVCRQIPYQLSFKAADPDSLEYATDTDPVYYYEPQVNASYPDSRTTVLVKVLPTSSSAVAKTIEVDYPEFDADGLGVKLNVKTTKKIDNFPEEAENLVVLRAAITAAEYLIAIEEDVELYIPILSTLKTQYQEAVMGLTTGNIIPQQQKAR